MDNPHLKELGNIGFEAVMAGQSYSKWESKFLIESIASVREYWDEITAVKECLANDDIEGAKANYSDIPTEHQQKIWRAPTKGGVFTTDELAKLKGVKK